MKIYIELNKKDDNEIVVINHSEEFLKNRELLKNQQLDFSSINNLKGDKSILNKAFLEELYLNLND